ncbi:SusC/RagA family TonB-linked outer membrane protein [Flavobacterium sp. NKUCC04_CG]|uniref:SusC/RagA family TonB-linked outer membrane protein n=1 Tax=Flavobacterium sp. NKUCC04_CG TaxID=2842121 RepID=UPI001C5BB3F5|nr:SusC/RagA family TonB-linked outer membrane protein [Flavobacterium sp. NKUCC04_CG]MBW3517724.1 SusC/RagA family TonB-linked outer membrane protein [Flavobacterium sp. NKUCC04_CG]
MKSKFKWILTLLVLAFSVQLSIAQEKTLSGVVSESGFPLPGVSIVIKGTQNGTQSDLDGRYSIKAKAGDVLVFTFIGLKNVSQTVGASNTLNVSMVSDDAMLEEVVVLAYGQVKKKNEITGNVVSIKGDVVSKVPLVSADQALQGRVAGLQMSTTSGAPGAQQNIRIRGRNSFSAGTEPLIVIDGVPMMTAPKIGDNISDASGNQSGRKEITSLSPLAGINSADIESMTVLKDAGSTAVYGARGANGVILITTKRGKSGATKFAVNTTLGFQNNAVKGPQMLNGAQRKELYLEAVYNTYGKSKGFGRDGAYAYAVNPDNRVSGGAQLLKWVNDGEVSTDWGDLVRRKDAPISSVNVSASGGDEKSNFYASLGHDKSEGTVIGADFRRISASLTMMRQLSDRVEFNTSVNVSNVRQNALLENGAYFSNPNLTKLFMSPYTPAYNKDGSYNLPSGGLANVLYIKENNYDINDYTKVMNTNSLSYKITDNLKFTTNLSLDYSLTDYLGYQNPVHGDGTSIGGSSSNYITRSFSYLVQNGLDYRFYIADDHRFDVKFVYEYQKFKSKLLQGYGEVIPLGFTHLGTAATNFNATGKDYDAANQGYVGILNYSYLNKYLIDVTARREANTRFSDDIRWGNFWSVGAAWNAHEEEFLKGSAFSTLRLRGSIGSNGNADFDVNQFQALANTVSYDGEGGIAPLQLGGPIGWEKQDKLDVGIQLGLFDNRITASAAYFKTKSSDMLMANPLSKMSGYDSQIQNIGAVENKGFEFELNVDVIRSQDFNWSIGGNLGTVKSEMTKMPIENGEYTVLKNSYKRDAVGQPIYAWHMPTYAGVNPKDGLAQWYKADGTTTSTYGDAEAVYQGGSPLPTYSGGVFTHLDYKGFFVDALFSFAGGHKVYEDWAAQTHSVSTSSLVTYNGVDNLMDRWQNPGDITDVPRVDVLSTPNAASTSPSSRFLYDGDYIRLRNVAFGYNFNSEALRFIKLDGITLSVVGTNLATWVKDSRLKYDPEIDASGFTSLTAPPIKSVVFSINVKF